MPYKSEKQKRFFRACKHGADYEGCPSDDVVDDFEKGEKKVKTFKEWLGEEYKAQTSSANYPMNPIRRPADLYRPSKGDNAETTHFDAIRHNAKLDADKVASVGSKRDIEDNKTMQKVGSIRLKHLFNPTHPDHKIEQAWFNQMSPDQKKHELSMHSEDEMQRWKERNQNA